MNSSLVSAASLPSMHDEDEFANFRSTNSKAMGVKLTKKQVSTFMDPSLSSSIVLTLSLSLHLSPFPPHVLPSIYSIHFLEQEKEFKTGALRVLVRVRPPISSEVQHGAAIFVDSETGISISSEKHDISCRYDKVFQEISNQQDVFNEISPLLLDVLKGYNACIFAYGQTSAGKTHTMLGPDGGQDLSKVNWGVLPRSADMLFNNLENKCKTSGIFIL